MLLRMKLSIDLKRNPMIKTIDHIGIAVKNLEKSLCHWRELFGLRDHGIEKIEEHGVKIVRLDRDEGPSVELVSPIDGTSPVDKFIKDHGEGIHHFCFTVDDIHSAMESLKKKGVEFIQDEPREGADGDLVVFIYPGCFNGVLIELKEEKRTVTV